MLEPGRKYSIANTNYRCGFNGKENDNDIENSAQDYGMRIYDGRLGRFLSVDPLFKDYPFYSSYQFSGNMPIAASDLDGKEAKVSFDYAAVSKDRSRIEVKASVDIKIQVINLSSIPDANIDLQNMALNLTDDLANKLSGDNTTIMELPFIFKSQGNHVTGIDAVKSKKDFKSYSVTFKTQVYPDVSVVHDISKINKDAWVFAIVDKVNDQKNLDVTGLVDVLGGKVAIGEAQNFEYSNAYKGGRQLALHEILHLLGATDSYPPNSALPGTQNNNNVMYFINPQNKRQLTQEQIVKEIMIATVGGISTDFTTPYKQPENSNSKTPTQQQLKTFINENGSATKIDKP